VIQAAAAGNPERAAQLWAETPIMQLKRDPSAAPRLAEIAASNVSLWALKSNPVQVLSPPAIDRLPSISVPTLILLGGADLPSIRAVGEILVQGIPGAKSVTIPEAGHILNLDARDAFMEALLPFLSGRA